MPRRFPLTRPPLPRREPEDLAFAGWAVQLLADLRRASPGWPYAAGMVTGTQKTPGTAIPGAFTTSTFGASRGCTS